MLRLLRILVFLLSVVFVGPIAFAAMASFTPTPKGVGQPSDALRLLRTFDDAFPQGSPNYSVDFDLFARQCGYGSLIAILGDLPSYPSYVGRNGWTPYEGYFDLKEWVSDAFYQGVEQARANQLNQRLSSFELKFLNRCIANSAFAKACEFRVRKVLEDGHLYSKYSLPTSLPRPNQDDRERTMCVFLDGIAARNGQKLGSATIGKE